MNETVAKHSTPLEPNHVLDPRSCHELFGNLRGGKIGSLPVSLLYFQLNFFLRDAHKNYAPEVGTIPRRLLEHNLKIGRSRATSEMLSIDADVVFEYDAHSKKTDITFKAYFQIQASNDLPSNNELFFTYLSRKQMA